MARPNKKGLDYFPIDTKLDLKLKLVLAKYKLKGIGFVDMLWRAIYDEGYYLKINEDNIIMLSNEYSLDETEFSEILSFLLEKDVFNKKMFEKHCILTSSGIQKRYFHKTLRRNKRLYKYILIDITANNNPDTANNNPDTANNKYTKVNKIKGKVNKIKGKGVKKINCDTITPDFIISFFNQKGFQNGIEAKKFYEFNLSKKLNENSFQTLAEKWLNRLTEKEKEADGYTTPDMEIISKVEKVFDDNIENFIKSINHFKIPGTDKFNEQEFYGNFLNKLNGLSSNLKAVKLLKTLISGRLKIEKINLNK